MIYTTLRCGKVKIAEGDREKIHKKMMKVVLMLPEHCQVAYYLMKLRGFSVREAALFQECSEEEVKRQVEEGLRFIRLHTEDIRMALKDPKSAALGYAPEP